MIARDYFVSAVAFVLGMIALASAFGITDLPKNLGVIRSIDSRWGSWASKLIFFVLAILMFASGTAIVSGMRPAWGEAESSSGRSRATTR